MSSTTTTSPFHLLPIPQNSLHITHTLIPGQSFSWKKVENDNKEKLQNGWRGVIDNAVLTFTQDPADSQGNLYWRKDVEREGKETTTEQMTQRLLDYFNYTTSPSLQELYSRWNEDAHFARLGSIFEGLRLIRQDPFECTLSFICSSNNNISRISSMLHKLRSSYGEFIGTVDGVSYHTFPTLASLVEKCTEQELRNSGFGYRAKYIVETCRIVKENGGVDWLNALRGKSRDECEEALQTLSGKEMLHEKPFNLHNYLLSDFSFCSLCFV